MTTRRIFDYSVQELRARIVALEKRLLQMRNDKIVTLPIRDESNPPEEAGEGDVMLGEDGLAYKFQNDEWTPLAGAGGDSITFTVPGVLSTFTGQARYHVHRAGTISAIYVALGGTAPNSPGVRVRVYKNGSSIGLSSAITNLTTGLTTTITPSPATFVSGDYFSVGITQVGTPNPGSYLVVQLVLGV